MAKHNEIGKIGEDLAAKWLESKGLSIIERNYRQKWGEIDIVARETDKVIFVEVKTVSYETRHDLEYAMSHNSWKPEDNVHTHKIDRLKRIIETWISEKKYNNTFEIQIIAVRLVPREKYARINVLKDVVFE